MLNLTRREKSVILFLALLYIAGAALFFGKKFLITDHRRESEKLAVKSEFEQLAGQVDSTYFSYDKVEKSGMKKEVSQRLMININTANKEALMKLKGIGPATAEKIIKYRTINGNFNSIEELKEVHGIGEKTLERIKGEVTIE